MTTPSDDESTGWVAPGQPAQPGQSPQPEAPAFQPQPQPLPMPLPPPPARPQKTNSLAIVSLVMGLFGCAVLLGVIFGVTALVQIRRSGERGRGLAVAGIVASVVWVVILALGVAAGLVSESDGGGSGSSDSSSAFQLYPKTGQCFDFTTGKPSVDTRVVSCGRPHDGEMIATFELPEGPWPGESEVNRAGTSGCEGRVTAKYRVPAPVENGELWIFFPRKLAWKFGDRKIHCTLIGAPGTKLTAPLGPGSPDNRRWDELKTGDCFTTPDHKRTMVVALSGCDERHTGQVSRSFELPQGLPHAGYPGESALRRKADKGCPGMGPKNGGPTPIEEWNVVPSKETWTAGDRIIVCYITSQDGDLKKPVLPK